MVEREKLNQASCADFGFSSVGGKSKVNGYICRGVLQYLFVHIKDTDNRAGIKKL